MTPLNWFRFEVSGRMFLKYFSAVFCSLFSLFVIGHADDWDGDGYDDTTGVWVGTGGSGGWSD
ncbi:MAG TPA: hypothetical protein PK648_12045 [Verrucomicrobiales bacterium]|nr:hypothetical protein [Verrucomicrobiales bacterium]